MLNAKPLKRSLLKVFLCVYCLLLLNFGCSRKSQPQTAAEGEKKSPQILNEQLESDHPSGNLAQNLYALMQKAELENSNGTYDTALLTWREIHRRVTHEFGKDAWQTISAELAMTAARQRTTFSEKDRELSSELTGLKLTAIRLLENQKYQQACEVIEKAASLSLLLWGEESFVTANINYIRAQCYFGINDNDRGLKLLNDVLDLRISLTGQNHPDIESTLELISQAQTTLNNQTAAEQTLQKLIPISGKLWGTDSEVYAKRLNDLGVSQNRNGKPLLALKRFEAVIQIRKKVHGDRSIQEAHARLNKGLAHAKAQQYSESMAEMVITYDLFHKHDLSRKDPIWVLLLDQLGTIALMEKKNLEAQKYFSELADHWRETQGESHLEYGKSLYKLGVCIGNQGKYEEAHLIIKRAINIMESRLGPNHKILHQPLTTYARLLEKLGGKEEAGRIKDRAVRLTGFQDLPE
ncbi:MAG: tetratricopeptide repeat protein [Pirellulaceae bacterium]|jgi:tetratricopeptide (TPR) repeat protein|nr:tetratricopeptide repeat protein [Mariniblastus sp.]MDG2471098.1 tetratricopeptide repeat protein [Pirellulaceae bacterium]